MDELTEVEFVAWIQDITTRKVFKLLEKKIKEIQRNLGTGGTLNASSPWETLTNTAKEVGKIEGIQEIFDLDVYK